MEYVKVSVWVVVFPFGRRGAEFACGLHKNASEFALAVSPCLSTRFVPELGLQSMTRIRYLAVNARGWSGGQETRAKQFQYFLPSEKFRSDEGDCSTASQTNQSMFIICTAARERYQSRNWIGKAAEGRTSRRDEKLANYLHPKQ